MAQQYNNASACQSPPLISGEQSMALIPSSPPSSTTVTNTPPPMENAMAVIPTSSPTSIALTAHDANVNANANASAGISAARQPPQMSTAQEGEEAWYIITRSLMVAVMRSQPAAMAASTLLAVFRPIVDGWAHAQKEGKRWKERADVYMADHHKHKMELAHKHDTLQTQVESLQQSLAESQRRVHEFESQQSTLCAKVSSLEKKLGEAEAQASAAKDAHAQEAHESKKEAEAIAKSARDTKLMYENLRQEADSKTKAQSAHITKLQEKIKDFEGIKARLEEQLDSTIAKTTSLETEVAQKVQDIAKLQTQVTELTTRKEALERQSALYQRIPIRRF